MIAWNIFRFDFQQKAASAMPVWKTWQIFRNLKFH